MTPAQASRQGRLRKAEPAGLRLAQTGSARSKGRPWDTEGFDLIWLMRSSIGDEIRASSRVVTFAPGAPVTVQGEPIREVYFIKSGYVRTYHLYPDGHAITLSYWTAGMMIGLPGLSPAGRTYLWSSEAVKSTEMYCLPVARFQDCLSASSEFQRAVVGLMELKIRHLSYISQMLAASSVVSRLGLALQSLVLMHGKREESRIAISIRLTHSDIADMVGASRQWINRSLHRLRQAGIIEWSDHRLVVLRPELLPQLATILQ